MSLWLPLFLLKVFYVCELRCKDLYIITTPNELLGEVTHQFSIFTSTDLVLTIKTTDPGSMITNKTDNFVLTKGIQSIPYFVPFVGPHVGKNLLLNFLADKCSSPKMCRSTTKIEGNFINETRQMNVLIDNFILFSETDKPIYKPQDTVKLRVMALYPTNLMQQLPPSGTLIRILSNNGSYGSVSTVRERMNNFDKIIIETPNRVVMASWRNVSFEEAMRLNFTLTRDPTFGKWKITTYLKSMKEESYFEVKEYVLPRFVVELFPPAVIVTSDKTITVKVCASYSTGKAMSALIRGELCIEVGEKICRVFASQINGTARCTDISIAGDKFGIGMGKIVYSWGASFVKVTVTENGTALEVTKEASGSSIRSNFYEIKLISKEYFKPGLPYFGKAKLLRYDGFPQKNTSVSININSDYSSSWGFQGNYTSNKDGIVTFVIPYIPVQSALSISFVGIEDSADGVVSPPTLYTSLNNWQSVDNEYIQISPLNKRAKCPGQVRLSLLTNGDVSTMTVFAQIFSRGLVNKMIEFPPVPVKCLSRNDHLGHYECVANGQIRCLKGWSGGSCREPVCAEGCSMGACISPDNCVCKIGWTGRSCSQCSVASYCVHGYCKYGNDCQCLPGWTGYKCDTKGPIFHAYDNRTSAPMTTQAPKQEPQFQNQTIFERYIDISLEKNMGPDVHIVVFYINNGNEVVADSLEISKGLSNCSQLGGGNFGFDRNEVNPRDMVKLFLDPGTVRKSCALKISDVALAQFGKSSNANAIYLINKLTELNHRIARESSSRLDRNMCYTSPRVRRSMMKGIWPWIGQGFDSRKAFTVSGLMPITNARVVNAMCRTYLGRERVYYADSMPSMNTFDRPGAKKKLANEKQKLEKKIDAVKKEIREYFPETWIFDYYNATPSQFNLTAPDSVTTWRANSFCMTEKGVWISKSRYLKVILPFYADIYVPYSIKMDEVLQLPVKLFNYVDDCYEIRTDIAVNASEIKITSPTSFTICVCPNDVKTIYFNIKANIIGKLNITVSATSQYSSFCSSSSNKSNDVNYHDAIRRQLLVEPSGIQKETTFSTLICNKKEELGVKATHSIPSSIVSGSLRSYLVYNGDVMGQTFDNLDRLVNMPYGCGEQNMVALVPSIYVLDYLTNVKIKNDNLKKRAMEFIVNGYRRQLNYKHDDGSYSAFGKSDKAGNTWLTAFVLRSFSDASKYVVLDEWTLRESVLYLEKMQSANGCFQERGTLLSSTMAGGLKNKGKTDESLLTAYVLTSLKSIKMTKTTFNISQALACVKSGLQASSSSYHLSLSGYALSIHELEDNFTKSVLQRLTTSSISTGRYRYWKSGLDNSGWYGQVNSADVETTGYALLALQNFQTHSESLSTIYWLSNQRNSLGGYYSTQDTIVALKAIAVYAETIGSTAFDRVDLGVYLDDDIQYKDVITDADRLVTRKIHVGTRNMSYITIRSNGTGCLSIQLVSLYNVVEMYTAKEEFRVRVTTELTNKTECTNMEVRVCSSYLRKDRNSNMILITVDFPSGWLMKDGEKKDLLTQRVSPLKRIDFQTNKMHLYYDSFSYRDEVTERCLSFRLDQTNKVDNLRPSFVRMVDYYKPEIYVDASLEVPTNSCKIATTTRPVVSKIPLCPVCFNDSDESVVELQSRLCPWSFAGIVSAGNKSLTGRLFYEPKQSMFYEWTVDLQPANCSCLTSWPHINEDFVVVSSQWLWPSENLSLSNTTALFPKNVVYRAYRSDLTNSCYTALHFSTMISRLFPDFKDLTAINETCASCVLSSNFYYKIVNISEFICSKSPRWSFEIASVNDTNIIGTLSNSVNVTIDVSASFPMSTCFCLRELRNLNNTFDIVESGYRILGGNYTQEMPMDLMLDDRFRLVERKIFNDYRKMNCNN